MCPGERLHVDDCDAGLTTYRFYVDMQDADRMSAGLTKRREHTWWRVQQFLQQFLERFRHQPCVLALVPGPGDTYATMTSASTSGIAGAADPSIVEDANQQDAWCHQRKHHPHGAIYERRPTDCLMQTDIMQVTTSGDISGQTVFPLGVQIRQPAWRLKVRLRGQCAVVRTALPRTTTRLRNTTTAV